MRTERVYHEVNGNPGISISGGRQMQYSFTRSYGYSTGMAILSVFFPMILSIVMVLQKAEYEGPITHIFKQ